MTNTKRLRRQFFVITIGLLLIIGQFSVPLQSIAYAATTQGETVLAFTSDVHNDQNNYTGETRLGTWIDNVTSRYNKIDAMAFAGDMAQYNSADTTFWNETQRVMNVVEGKGVTAYYTTGNHEYDHDSSITNDFYPDKNEVTQKYIQNDWAVENGSNYRLYCMGVGEASGYTFVNNAYTANQVATLRDKLAAVDNSKPIFIITHFPLHHTAQTNSSNSRTITRASDVIDVLNTAANGGTPSDPSDDKKIIFIWGHNHSMNSPNDTHYDTIYQKGSSLQYDSSHSKELQFFYAAAGAMCDTEKDAGSGKVEGKGLVATINSNNQISLSYHKADGTTVTKNGGPFEEKDPVAVENMTIDEADAAGENGLSVEAGKKLQLHATIEPSDATETSVTWSSSNNAVATVSDSGQVTGVAEGQATITASLTDSVSGESFTASIDVNVTARISSGTPYVLTNTLTPGKNYLIVSANSGDAFALMNDNGTISKEAVTIDGDTIYTDNEDVVFEAQGSGTTINDLHNGNRYLKAHNSGLELLEIAGTSRPWEYNGTDHKLTNYKSTSGSATHYYVYYENGSFASSTSTSASHVVYLFEETEIPEDVTYNITFKVQNGKWNDNTSADKTVQVTGPEGSVTLDANQIPAVGDKPNAHYKVGDWNVAPDTTNPLTGNVTYTYTYEEQSSEKAYVLTDTLTPGKNYIIASANSGTAHVLTSSSATAAEVTIDGDTIYTDDKSMVFKMGEGSAVNYIGNEDGYVHHTSDNYVDFVSTPPSGITWTYDGSYLTYKDGGNTYYLYYKSGTNYNRYRIKSPSTVESEHLVYLFEEVPTEVSHTVTFQVENGKWNDNSTEEKTVDLTGTPGTELKLSADQIPAVGEKPNTHYKAGAWDVTPDTDTAITEDTIYKYTYEYADHVWGEGVVTTQPTCTTKGVKTFTCENCDATRTVEVAALGHDMTTHPAKEPTCTEAGNYEYYSCDRCNKFFADAMGLNEVEEGSWVIPGGHDWSKPTYTWADDNSSVTAEYHCTADGCDETVTETANTTSEVTKDATCTEAGETTYTATFTGEAFENQTKVDNTKPAATGHDWSKPTYTWADDNSTVTAECHCTNEGCTEEITETANTTSEVTKEATCEENGETTYTATFRDENFEEQTKVDNTKPAATGHDWSKPTYTWADDNSSVTGKYNCTTVGCNEEVTETVATTAEVIQQATCTQHEETTWTSADFEDRTFEQQIKTEQSGPALGHNMEEHKAKDATCTDAGNSAYWSCDRCNKFFSDEAGENEIEENSWEIPETGHKWDYGTVTKAPTCTTTGVRVYTCDNCDSIRTEDIDAFGHLMFGHPAKEATCTEVGNTAYWSCDRCMKFFSDEEGENEVAIGSWVIEAKGHKWDAGEITTQPTCTEKGVRTFHCENCDATRTEDVNALGHDWSKPTYTWADDNSSVTAEYHCTADGCDEQVTETVDTDSEVTKAATCTAPGETTYTATFKDEAFEEQTKVDKTKPEATGHDWSKPTYTWADDNSSVTAECHCTNEGCNEEITETVNTTSEVTKEATCEENGETTYTATFRDENFEEQTKVDNTKPAAKGHNMDAHAAKAATCTEAGNSAYWSCNRCNKFFEDENGTKEIEENSWVIKANGHDWSKPTYAWADDNSSVTAEYHCTADGCDETVTETVDTNSEVTKAATCTASGETTYTATFKDEKFEEQTKVDNTKPAAKGHNMDAHAAKAATCTEAGNSAYWSCDRCNKFFEDENGTKEIEENSWVIKANGHDWSKPTYAWDDDNSSVTAEYHCTADGCDETVTETVDTNSEVTKAATCTASGETTYTATFKDEKFEEQTKVDNTKPAAKGHNMDAHAVKAATCTEAGNSKYYSCDRCHKFFSDEEGNTEIEENSWVINATGHSWDNGTVTTQPTCTAKGVKTFNCENCDATRTEDVNALGHDMKEHKAKDATCTESGNSKYYSCDRCHKFFSDEEGNIEIEENSWVIEATGHDWSKPTYTWADDNSNVTAEYHCTADGCDEQVTETVDTSSEVAKAATCTAPGETTYTATFKDEKFEEQTKVDNTKPAAKGHNMDAHAAKAATCTEAGNSAYWSCDRCNKFFEDENGTKEIEENSWVIEAKGHSWDAGTVTTQPTCTAKGVKTFNCENCDATRTEDVNALGHNMDAHAAKAATCTEAGNGAYWSCDRCNKFFEDENGTKEIEENSWVIEAKGHSWNEGTITIEPTCTEKGAKTFECENCDATKTEDIAATGHDYGAWTNLNATQHHRFCNHDKSHEQKENHKWDAGKVTKAATTTSTGIKTYTCTVCKATKTAIIPKKVQAAKPIIVAKAISKGAKAFDFTWNKVAGANRYIVYLSFCSNHGKNVSLKKIATIKAGKLTYRKTNLKANASYKFKVVAQKKVNGKFKTIATSLVGHSFSSGYQGKFTNPKSIVVNKAKVTLKKGKTFKIKATVKKLVAKKKMMPTSHAAVVRYLTSNSKIATVSKVGKITAKAKGTCDIYAIAQNGIWKKIKVTVK